MVDPFLTTRWGPDLQVEVGPTVRCAGAGDCRRGVDRIAAGIDLLAGTCIQQGTHAAHIQGHSHRHGLPRLGAGHRSAEVVKAGYGPGRYGEGNVRAPAHPDGGDGALDALGQGSGL